MSDVYVSLFFHDTPTPHIYTLSLHDALPISPAASVRRNRAGRGGSHRYRCARDLPVPAGTRPDRQPTGRAPGAVRGDRKSTRLNSSHVEISYAVFCLKKKKNIDDGYWFTCGT